MTTTERTTAVGVFTERHLAEHALEELQSAGFTNDHIGFVSREGTATEEQPAAMIPPASAAGGVPMAPPLVGLPPGYTQTDIDGITPLAENKTEATAAGAVSGGVVGGVLGAAAALLIPGLGPAIAGGILTAIVGGAAIGAVAGGLIGALTTLGVPEEEARFYQDELQAGRTLVTVQTKDRYDEALEILHHNGAYDATTRRDTTNTPPTDIFTSDTTEVHDEALERASADTQQTNARPAPFPSDVPPASVDQMADTENREPEVPPPTYHPRF